MLAVGGSVAASAKRAARLGLPLFAGHDDPELGTIYEAECARLGHEGGWTMIPSGPMFVHVSDDPERDWARIGPVALDDAAIMARSMGCAPRAPTGCSPRTNASSCAKRCTP